jgi:hypothetical protein
MVTKLWKAYALLARSWSPTVNSVSFVSDSLEPTQLRFSNDIF